MRLSPDEAWEVVERAHTGILTTLRRDGWPISLPVWFVALDRHIYVSGPARTRKFTRVSRDPRVAFMVESGRRWADLVAVHLTGRARIVSEPELLDRTTAALHAKYASFRTPRTAMPDATRAGYEGETATIEIVPDERILSWDNSRLDLQQPEASGEGSGGNGEAG